MKLKHISIYKLLHKTTPNFFSTAPQLSQVRGQPFTNPINHSTGVQLLKMTEKYPSKIALHCYEQNK